MPFRERSCPMCGTVCEGGRCPNEHCPSYGFRYGRCPNCLEPLDVSGQCESDVCDTNRPTHVDVPSPPRASGEIPCSSRARPFAPSKPPKQSYRNLIAVGTPMDAPGLYSMVRETGTLSSAVRQRESFFEEEPPTIPNAHRRTQSGTQLRIEEVVQALFQRKAK